MGFLFYLSIFLLGLCVGSFLNSIIFRLSTGESFWFSRSYCPHCKHILGWQDLVPIFSFLILKGKCRYCQKPISWQYPSVELATGILFLISFLFTAQQNLAYFPHDRFLFMLNLFFNWIIISFLIIIFVYDLKHYIIPDKVIYPAIILALIFNFFVQDGPASGWQFSILSALGAAAFFLAIVLISRGKWMGVGDIKLAFLMGLFLGWPNILVALFIAFFLGAIMGIGLILAKRKTLKSEVPFGPFLVSGTFIALFWSRPIINWYFNLFL